MLKTIHPSLSTRRAMALVAIAALLAAVFLVKGSLAFRAVASPPAGTTAAPAAIIYHPPCDSAAIAFISSPVEPGYQLAVTASSTGCLNPVYRFLVQAPGSGIWVYETAYQTSPDFTFDSRGVAQGVWQVDVLAKDLFSAASYQTWAISSFTVAVPRCTAVNFYQTPSAPTPVGTPVQVDGAAIGCPLAIYSIFMLSPGSKTWVNVLKYRSPQDNFYNWDTTGLARGGYRFSVWARELQSTNKYDTYAVLTHWLT